MVGDNLAPIVQGTLLNQTKEIASAIRSDKVAALVGAAESAALLRDKPLVAVEAARLLPILPGRVFLLLLLLGHT